MTTVFMVDDPDPDRRRRALAGAMAHVQEHVPIHGSFERGSVALAWSLDKAGPLARSPR